MIFANSLETYGDKVAIYCQDGSVISYRELHERVKESAMAMGTAKKLVAVECSNHVESIVAYLAALYAQNPVILVGEGACIQENAILSTFEPELTFKRAEHGVWQFQTHDTLPASYHNELCILLSTSGTTGSAKLVRLSRQNIQSNAQAIAQYLNITKDHIAITTLPYHYSYGMSVINSHLAVGASIVLTNDSVADASFWQLIEKYKVTSFAGVPYTFELLERQGFRTKRYPSLKYITQAGGRLPRPLVEKYNHWAKSSGCSFYVMYGQTEAAPRIAYVPPELLKGNEDCIGQAIPEGVIELHNEDGQVIDQPDIEGELVYKGNNVMMGYATQKSDLQLPSGEKSLRTGDLAIRKANGLFKIVGRKSRFCKLFGLRISLDEVEAEVHRLGISSVVVGNDEFIAIAVLQQGLELNITQHLVTKYKLNIESFSVILFDEYPLLSSGKVDQRKILSLAAEQRKANAGYHSILDAFQKIMNNANITSADSFVGIGGDSLFFVMVSIAIEEYLGFLPENWEGTRIEVLEALKNADRVEHSDIARKNGVYSIALICCLLILGELFLQARTYHKTGRSALALLTGQSTTVFHENIGVTTYRPNLKVIDAETNMPTMEINSVGFRSNPIPETGTDTRIAIMGASTVAGAYAKSNQYTFPALFGQLLAENGDDEYHVINAGIEGHTIENTQKLFEGVISGLKPDVVMLYPGFNDITLLCRAESESQKSTYDGIPYPKLPIWILTKEMIRKNTTVLRANNLPNKNILRPYDIEPAEYGDRIRQLVTSIQAQKMIPALITVSRSYRNVADNTAYALAQESLYYYSCLNSEGLIAIGEMYNEQIRLVAKEMNVPLFDVAKTMPGGREYFVDGGHFTFAGEQYVANFLFQQFKQLDIMQEEK